METQVITKYKLGQAVCIIKTRGRNAKLSFVFGEIVQINYSTGKGALGKIPLEYKIAVPGQGTWEHRWEHEIGVNRRDVLKRTAEVQAYLGLEKETNLA